MKRKGNNRWKSNAIICDKTMERKKITVMLLILGFLVGNLVLSVGTSVAVENVKMLEDQTSGNRISSWKYL